MTSSANINTFLLLPPLSDIKECLTESHGCHENARCRDTPGSYECVCASGYHGDGKDCTGKYSVYVCACVPVLVHLPRCAHPCAGTVRAAFYVLEQLLR